MRDITKRKRAEAALRESEERVRLLLNSTAEGIYGLDLEGNCTFCNPSALRFLGYRDQSDLLGKNLHELIHHTRLDGTHYPVEECRANRGFRRGEGVHNGDDVFWRADGTSIPVEYWSFPIHKEGEVLGAVVTFLEITERKRRENQLHDALSELKEVKKRLEAENVYLKGEIELEHDFSTLIGHSDIFRRVLKQIEQVARTDATVLILGETGTGKELLAHAVHNLSPRKDHSLVKVNCAALPANLIESELFGHEKGAFTGATSRKVGRFELANGGTIFLDEIGDLPLELQAKLLRVLQEGEFERVGGTSTIKVDVRVVAATNQDLEIAMAKHNFRQDLYYRLNIFPVHSPSLRERPEDIPDLVRFFIQKHGRKIGKRVETVPKNIMDSLQTYHWPGNVRELENVIERSLIISREDQFTLADSLRHPVKTNGKAGVTTLAEMEKQYIAEVLEATGWRVSGRRGAAEILGLKPTTLEARMKRLGIQRKEA